MSPAGRPRCTPHTCRSPANLRQNLQNRETVKGVQCVTEGVEHARHHSSHGGLARARRAHEDIVLEELLGLLTLTFRDHDQLKSHAEIRGKMEWQSGAIHSRRVSPRDDP